MGITSRVPKISALRPCYSLGGLFDIPTGTWHIGENGESILNSGLDIINSIAGPGNSFKSTMSLYFQLCIAERYWPHYRVSIYDTESSMRYARLESLAWQFPRVSELNFTVMSEDDDPMFSITSGAELAGDEYFSLYKEAALEKQAKKTAPKSLLTPFRNPITDKPIYVLPPEAVLIDSLSNFEITSISDRTVNKNAIGDSANNMMFANSGAAKKQMIGQLPTTTSRSNIMFNMVAHVGDEFEFGQFTAKKHKLTHAKRGSKVTGTTKGFEFINNILLEIHGISPLNNSTTGTGVLYPDGDLDRDPESIDLLNLKIVFTRNKNGLTGTVVNAIVSQRDGFLPHLTQFHYCKERDWGIDGSAQNYTLSLRPDTKLSRTTVRGKIKDSLELRRACEIQSEMLQMNRLWEPLPDDLMCTPQQLYTDLKEKGYDWDVLLNTRGYWVFKEQEKDELPFLSTMDLLRMRKDLYEPYWLKDK